MAICWREDLIGDWSTAHVSTLEPGQEYSTSTCVDAPVSFVRADPEPVVYRVRRKRKNRKSVLDRSWSAAVKARDGSCRRCGSTSELRAHHIKPRSKHPELALDLLNGEALCNPCHRMAHPELPDSLFL